MQPEWFYKGDGSVVVKPGGSFLSPKFALDGSEEPECVGLYVISDEGIPFRVGYVRSPCQPIAPQHARGLSAPRTDRSLALWLYLPVGARQ